jgi:RimJ/RimL family protein N-acetyltransferase
MIVLETDRLNLRHLTEKDAEFVLELLNEPSFLRGIGDRGVRTVEQARRYVLDVPVASYEEHGFGLYLVELKETREPLGMCGLVNREGLEGIDVGFAFLPAFWSQGYAFESASAVMSYARDTLGLQRVVAIASPDNERSFKLLEKLGLEFDSMTRLSEDEPELSLYSIDF